MYKPGAKDAKTIGNIFIIMGLVAQTVEFVGWIDVIIEAIQQNIAAINATGYAILGSQIFLYAYSLMWLFQGKMHFKIIVMPILHLMFLAAFIISSYLLVFIILQGGSFTDDLVAAIIFGIFFGSDMAMAGGLIYIMRNYTPPAPPSNGSYMALAQPNLAHRVVQLPNKQLLLV